jgi:hypothetical protein
VSRNASGAQIEARSNGHFPSRHSNSFCKTVRSLPETCNGDYASCTYTIEPISVLPSNRLPTRGSLACNLHSPHSIGFTAMCRAAEGLGLQVRQHTFVLAMSDVFFLMATCCVACLVVVAYVFTAPTSIGKSLLHQWRTDLKRIQLRTLRRRAVRSRSSGGAERSTLWGNCCRQAAV